MRVLQVVRHERASIKADIWSYGILIWELVTGEDITEYQPLSISRQVRPAAGSQASPTIPLHVTPCCAPLNLGFGPSPDAKAKAVLSVYFGAHQLLFCLNPGLLRCAAGWPQPQRKGHGPASTLPCCCPQAVCGMHPDGPGAAALRAAAGGVAQGRHCTEQALMAPPGWY